MDHGDKGTYAENFGEDFQLHLLAAVARHPGFAVSFRSALDYKFFSNPVHRIVARTLLEYSDKYQSLPTVATLVEKAKVQAGDDEVEQVKKAVKGIFRQDIRDAKAVIDMAREFGQTQALANAVMDSVDLIESGNQDQIVPLIQQAMMVGQDILDIGIHFNKANRATIYEETSVDYIPTGITHLDHILRGGLGRGELGVVLAPPGRGKTTALTNFGYGGVTAAKGYNVVHYSLEMHKNKIAVRYDDRMAGNALKYKLTDPEKYQRMMDDRAEKLLRGHLYIQSYPTRSMGVSMIRSHLSILSAQDFAPDVIIVDYGDIMKAERRRGDMRHEQAGIYEDLRTLAGEFNAAVWTASQTPRSALSKEVITIEDFAESFEKAAIADAVLGFCQSENEPIEKRMRFFLAKLRNVEDGGVIECTIDRARASITSNALYDAAQTRVWTPEDDKEEEDDGTETVTYVHGGKEEQAPVVQKKKSKAKPKRVKKASRRKAGGKKYAGKTRAKKRVSKRVPKT